jgi:hypothetical protein
MQFSAIITIPSILPSMKPACATSPDWRTFHDPHVCLRMAFACLLFSSLPSSPWAILIYSSCYPCINCSNCIVFCCCLSTPSSFSCNFLFGQKTSLCRQRTSTYKRLVTAHLRMYASRILEYILCFSPFILKVCFGGPSHGRCKTCYIMIPNRKMQVPANEKIIAFGSFSYLKKGIVIFLYNHFYIYVIPQLYSSIRKKERARPENYIA